MLHPPLERPPDHAKYAAVISAALRKELGNTHCAAKTVMQWTGASERTVKYWFAGTKGPSGEHLVMLAHHSDTVLTEFLPLPVGQAFWETMPCPKPEQRRPS